MLEKRSKQVFLAEFGVLIVRITLGVIFFVHGLAKFQGGVEIRQVFLTVLEFLE